MPRVEREVADRQLEALLQRLDGIHEELRRLNARLDADDGFARVTRELATLNESLQTIAYAALGTHGPQVRRRGG
jgi:archaellum component FlaC